MKARAVCVNRRVDKVEGTRDSPNSYGRPRNVRQARAKTGMRISQILPSSPTNIESRKSISGHNLESLDLSGQSLDTRLFTLTSGHPEQRRDMNHKKSDVFPWSSSRASTASILRFLPPRPVADYLVAVYFNTVHWFVVIVHEGNFLHNYEKMMDLYTRDAISVPDGDESFTFALLILTMVAMGGSVPATEPKGLTPSDDQHFDISEMVSQLFSVVHKNSTDNLACGTLSTVQSMLLLGNLYLYHGHSNLALAQAACTVRLAYTLGLARKDSELFWTSPYYQHMDPTERHQLKCRLFWAVHTSDRFLAMCYGLPPLIPEEECVADIPRDDCAYPANGFSSFLMLDVNQAGTYPGQTTLLTYQTHKLKFYIILGRIIQSVQRGTTGNLGNVISQPSVSSSTSASTHDPQSKPEPVVNKVRQLDRALKEWHNDLPPFLRLPDSPDHNDVDLVRDGDDGVIIPGDDDRFQDSVHIRERRSRIKKSIYGMQALLLQVAYDHALILIHRPILTLRLDEPEMPPKAIRYWSISTCWTAALRMSNIGWHHIFNPNQHTHAVSFVGVHLFAAGVVLSAFASGNPLSKWAVEAKKGLSRVIKMQHFLKDKAVVSAQSLDILRKLAHEVMKKEEEAMFGEEPCYDSLQIRSERRELHTSIPSNCPTYQGHLPVQCPVTHLGESIALESAQTDIAIPTELSEDDTEVNDNNLLYDSFFDLSDSMAEVDKPWLSRINSEVFDLDEFSS
ncbi:unnamed protein product [Penicillium pancosmium]